MCLAARDDLVKAGHAVRVVSMPSWELFDDQPASYRAQILPPDVPKLAVEAAVSFGWDRWVDDVVAIDRFGASAPGPVVLDKLGINPGHVVERANALLASPGGTG